MASKRHLLAALAVALLWAPAAAAAPRVAVVVVPPFPLERYAAAGAVGLLVPGSGSAVTRADALAALRRGRVRTSLLGGEPAGPPEIALSRRPAEVTVYVSLPPRGRHANDVRYPVAVVGGGYRGLLVSSATRIPGLVSVADVAPTVLALEAGKTPRIGSRPDAGAVADLRRLDARLHATRGSRVTARLGVVALLLAGFAAAFLLRSRTGARAALLAAPAALSASLALGAAHEYRPAAVALAILAAGAAGHGIARLGDRATAAVVVLFLAAFLAALAAWPWLAGLSPIGPHPDAGGRYYGITNEVETLLLAPMLFAGAVLGVRRLALPAVLALVLVGWSRAGADGGGVLVVAAAFGALALRLRAPRFDPRRLALVLAAAVAVGVVLVALDAATGGSSHVTRALGGGPGSLAGVEAHRLHVSWAAATKTWTVVLQTVGCAFAIAVFAGWGRRGPAFDALLVALAVSLLVNDTPQDVLSFGALGAAALWAWARTEEGPVAAPMPVDIGAASGAVPYGQ